MPIKELNEQVMEQIDRKFYAGNQTIRMLERALGSVGDNNEQFNKGISNEMINRGKFNPNYQHNNFNSFFNNNRAVNRDPMHYKSPQVLNNWQQNQGNRQDNNIFNAFNQVMVPNPHHNRGNQYPRQNYNQGYQRGGYQGSQYNSNYKRPRPEYVILT